MKNITIIDKIDKGQYLYKYLDIHKFISFISTQSLYLSRMDKLEDPNEGINIQTSRMAGTMTGLLKSGSLKNQREHEMIKGQQDLAIKISNETQANAQKTSFVSCWFMGNRESTAMWDLYSNNDSVAIIANPESLLESIDKGCSTLNFNYSLNAVKMIYDYIDPYDPFKVKDLNRPPSIGLIKDICYSHEKEYRFMLQLDNNDLDIEQIEIPIPEFNKPNSYRIICHPKMENWKKENIKKLMLKFNIDVKLSDSQVRIKNG